MNHYEAVYILDPKLDDEQLNTMKVELKSKIESVAAQDILEIKCERRQLYAPIKKQREAYYLVYGFQAPGDAVGKLRTELKHTEHIMRMSYVRVPTASVPEPKPVMPTPPPAPVPPPAPEPVVEPQPEPITPGPAPDSEPPDVGDTKPV